MNRSRVLKFALLAAGLCVAFYLGARSPREQHVTFVLGDAAPEVRELDVAYVDEDGEVAREVRLTYGDAGAPRVASHEPKLADGMYRLRIDASIRDRRVSVERSVTLGGGSSQVDLSSAFKE